MLAQGIETGKVQSRTKASSYDRGQCSSPKLLQGIGTCEYFAKGGGERGGVRLLNAGFEKVGWLEERG
jgi:hypothetical protein